MKRIILLGLMLKLLATVSLILIFANFNSPKPRTYVQKGFVQEAGGGAHVGGEYYTKITFYDGTEDGTEFDFWDAQPRFPDVGKEYVITYTIGDSEHRWKKIISMYPTGVQKLD